MDFNSWTTIFEGSFNKSFINKQLPLRFYIDDFIRKTDVVDLTEYIGDSWQYPSTLYEYRVVATSQYGDTQTSKPIEVYPAYRNPELLSQMPAGWYNQPMSIVRQPMLPHYPANIIGYDPCILIYRKNNAPDLKTEEGIWFADSKGLILNMMSIDFDLKGRSYFIGVW